jgi:hypothetical protein
MTPKRPSENSKIHTFYWRIVFAMCTNEFHLDSLVAVCHQDYQTIVMALNVEDNPAVF